MLSRHGRCWCLLESGRYATVNELARAENINASHVGHILRLTLLAPDLVEAILHGRRPPAMQLQPLIQTGFPVEWERQREMFAVGCGNPARVSWRSRGDSGR